MEVAEESLLAERLSWLQLLRQARKDVRAVVMKPLSCLQYLQLGRVVFVSQDEMPWGWGVVKRVLTSSELRSTGRPFISRSGVTLDGAQKEERFLEVFLEVVVQPITDEQVKAQSAPCIASVFSSREEDRDEGAGAGVGVGVGGSRSRRQRDGRKMQVVLVSLEAVDWISSVRYSPSTID